MKNFIFYILILALFICFRKQNNENFSILNPYESQIQAEYSKRLHSIKNMTLREKQKRLQEIREKRRKQNYNAFQSQRQKSWTRNIKLNNEQMYFQQRPQVFLAIPDAPL